MSYGNCLALVFTIFMVLCVKEIKGSVEVDALLEVGRAVETGRSAMKKVMKVIHHNLLSAMTFSGGMTALAVVSFGVTSLTALVGIITLAVNLYRYTHKSSMNEQTYPYHPAYSV